MARETAEMRPPRKGPKLRQTSPERRPGATGGGAGGSDAANVPRVTSRSAQPGNRRGTVVRAIMSDELASCGSGGTQSYSKQILRAPSRSFAPAALRMTGSFARGKEREKPHSSPFFSPSFPLFYYRSRPALSS